MRIRLAGAVALGALLGSTVLVAPVWALLTWTLVATPLTATAGQSTTFSLTATNLDLLGELGCLEVVLPSTWTGVTVGGAVPSTEEDDWVASANGNTVVVNSTSGGGRLETGQSVSFTITATPTTEGVQLWPNHAHQRHDCGGPDETGTPLSIVVAPALAATPTPTPSPTPSPAPTPKPTPSPRVPPPSSHPSPTGLATPSPEPSATDTPGATPRPAEGASPEVASTDAPSPSAQPGRSGPAGQPSAEGGGRPPGGSSGAPGPRSAPLVDVRVPGASGTFEIALGGLGLLEGVEIWIVPAATIGVPGLLLLVWIGLQALGAFAWVPAIRRLRGDGPT